MSSKVSSAAWPYYLALFSRTQTQGVMLAVTANNQMAERLHDDLVSLLGPERTGLFPHWETLPFERVSPSHETVGSRLKILSSLSHGELPAGYVMVSSVRALMQRLSERALLYRRILRKGEVVDLTEFSSYLAELGYVREYQAENRGEFSVRGSIVDVFPPSSDLPVRIDLFGDEIDTLNHYDPSTQRSIDSVASFEVLPARELVLDGYVRNLAERGDQTFAMARGPLAKIAAGEYFDGVESWLPWMSEEERLLPDLLGENDAIFLLEPSRLLARAQDLLEEESSLEGSLAATWGLDPSHAFPKLHLSYDRTFSKSSASVGLIGGQSASGEGFATWELSGREIDQLVTKVQSLLAQGFRVTVAAENTVSKRAISASFEERGLSTRTRGTNNSRLEVQEGVTLSEGAILWPYKVAVLSEADLTGRRRSHRMGRPRRSQAKLDFEALTVGGYVVHDVHGVARYLGMTQREMGGIERDYLLLEYRGGDKIYVPSDQLEVITPYKGGDSPSLSRLGGSDWQATKAKAKKAAREIAQELVVLYQRRSVIPGHAYASDTPWQLEMESIFPYELTKDQARAIREVKEDMESVKPMDRLVCGDVGFGKTEIAIRAAFKAVQESKQVAILVPTTLLASQHFQTFSDRLQGQPVRVEMLSRFLTNTQVKEVLTGLEEGTVDVVVGTHRLLSSEVRFKSLGLLVVDEEQRFGVSHKEAIKKMSAGVDVLTLSATPIPRTLELSLTGIRDLSLLHTAPAQRRPILTHVGESDELAISEAIRRELLRDGQVFYVHNRVQDIELVAERLRALVPEARIAVAHGQMDEGTLEQVVLDFWEQRFDVLVCTTIIESGIDMPTVNTLVVDRADMLGLGQLHQLRGRVGRSGLRAYAYLFFPRDAALSEEAFERLRTIGENTELGSGYRIAMRDLEIRGAGNLLGASQSGHMAAVGYDMYVRMVQEAVAELKGEIPPEPLEEVSIDLPVTAYIPSHFMAREDLRLDAYRRLTTCKGQDELDDFSSEIIDRFGPLPDPVVALVDMVRLKLELRAMGVRSVVLKRNPHGSGEELRVAPLKLPTSQQMRLRRLFPKSIYKEPSGELVVPVIRKGSPAEFVRRTLATLEGKQ